QCDRCQVRGRCIPLACTRRLRRLRIIFPWNPLLPPHARQSPMHIYIRTAARAGLAALALLAAPLAAFGDSNIEVAAGPSTTTDREFTRVASVAWLPEVRRLDNAVLRAETGVFYVDGRDPVRDRDLTGNVWVGYVGLRYERTDNGLTL